MPLRDVQMSDDAPAILVDRIHETRRELHNAYERIEELEGGIKGLLGLLSLLQSNCLIPESVREEMLLNHRVIDAQEMLRP